MSTFCKNDESVGFGLVGYCMIICFDFFFYMDRTWFWSDLMDVVSVVFYDHLYDDDHDDVDRPCSFMDRISDNDLLSLWDLEQSFVFIVI